MRGSLSPPTATPQLCSHTDAWAQCAGAALSDDALTTHPLILAALRDSIGTRLVDKRVWAVNVGLKKTIVIAALAGGGMSAFEIREGRLAELKGLNPKDR